MSIKSKVLATAASLTMVGGVLAVSTLATATAAKAETPSCGAFNFFCVDLFSKQFGTHKDPGFIQDVYRQGNRVGQQIILFRISSSDPAEDFTTDDLVCTNATVPPRTVPPTTNPCPTFTPYTVGYLQAISGNTLFNPITAAQYANSFVVENEYAPFGVNSGLCAGIAATPFNGEGVTLQPCGFTARTLWIINSSNPIFSFIHGYTSLINGANQNFSHPYVLTYPANGYPTDLPRPQLNVHQIQTFSQGFPFVVTQQLWGADFGTIPGT
jgi:hypothetical protein